MNRLIVQALESAAEEQGARVLRAELTGERLEVCLESAAPIDAPRFRARACWQYHVASLAIDASPPTRQVLPQFVHMRLDRGGG